MMIFPEKCQELGLPIPKGYEKQRHYVARILVEGYRFNTRMARYIGIGNLHSVVSALNDQGLLFEIEHFPAECPFTNETPPHRVDIIYMTSEQRRRYLVGKEKPSLEQTREG